MLWHRICRHRAAKLHGWLALRCHKLSQLFPPSVLKSSRVVGIS
jgi:hypothetical protein